MGDQLIQELQAVEIEINHSCNRSCSYCPNSALERKTKGKIQPQLFQKILTELAELKFQGRISYSFYNEPTLHPQLESLVRETRQSLPLSKLHLYTNGTLLTPAKYRGLLNAGVDRLIVTQHEEDELPEAQYQFSATLAELSPDERSNLLFRSSKEIQLVNRGGLLKHLGAEGLPLLPCHLPSHLLTITVDGKVLSCFEDFNEENVFGNLQNQKLVDIWNSKKYIQFRKDLKRGLRHLHRPCRDCNRTEVLPPFDV